MVFSGRYQYPKGKNGDIFVATMAIGIFPEWQIITISF